MGEAKRKAAELKTFLGSLSEEEKILYDLTQRLITKLIEPSKMTGACYWISILLNRVLAKEYGIESDVVLGWIHDGDNLFISHAWLEMRGKKTDLMAERPGVDSSKRGPTIILDYIFKGASNTTYCYYLDKTPEALAKDEEEIAADPTFLARLRAKDKEHARIARAIASDAAKDAFLAKYFDPDGESPVYAKTLELIR